MRATRLVYDAERKIYHPALQEEHVVTQIMQGLAAAGAKVYRVVERIPKRGRRGQIVGKFSTPGIPDLFGRIKALDVGEEPYITRWVNFWIEVKRPGGKRRPSQTLFISDAQLDGQIAGFAESWNDVVRIFAVNGIELPA